MGAVSRVRIFFFLVGGLFFGDKGDLNAPKIGAESRGGNWGAGLGRRQRRFKSPYTSVSFPLFGGSLWTSTVLEFHLAHVQGKKGDGKAAEKGSRQSASVEHEAH